MRYTCIERITTIKTRTHGRLDGRLSSTKATMMLRLAAAGVLVLSVYASSDQKINWKNVTGTSSVTFPTDVGVAGDRATGKTPLNAENDPLDTSRFQENYGIEMRWLPKDAEKNKASPDDIFTNLGPYTPWRPAKGLFPETEAYRSAPKECELKQVQLLYRHGARYPTDGMNEGLPKLVHTIANGVKNGSIKATGELDFMNHWNYTLGEAILVHQGAQELFDAGVKDYYSYGKLLDNIKQKPVIRTTSISRMLDSARYWTLGFFGWDATDKMNMEVILEADHQNNTLEPKYACPNGKAFKFGSEMRETWQKVYLKDALNRFQRNLHGFNLTISHMADLISLCPYETVGYGYSHFCNLFTKEEWEGYEYGNDLKFQGNNGFMNPEGKAMGLGWVQEFFRRATKDSFKGPAAEKNMTLDNNSTYFPLDQALYADFSHDTVIMSILTAFNFTQLNDHLDPTKPDPSRKFRASQIVPFGARVAFEIWNCQKTDFLRVKLNEAVIPLDQDQGCQKRKDGLCKLDDFVNHLQDRVIQEANFDLTCFGKNGTDFNATKPVDQGHF